MKAFKITYFLYPEKDIEVVVAAKSEEEAIVLAKAYRNNSFSIEQIEMIKGGK